MGHWWLPTGLLGWWSLGICYAAAADSVGIFLLWCCDGADRRPSLPASHRKGPQHACTLHRPTPDHTVHTHTHAHKEHGQGWSMVMSCLNTPLENSRILAKVPDRLHALNSPWGAIPNPRPKNPQAQTMHTQNRRSALLRCLRDFHRYANEKALS